MNEGKKLQRKSFTFMSFFNLFLFSKERLNLYKVMIILFKNNFMMIDLFAILQEDSLFA